MEELIDRAKKKDEKAFVEAVLLIQKELYLLARVKLNNEADIDDAVQETIIAGYKNLYQLKQVQYFKTWMIKILMNQCNKIYKKNSKRLVPIEEVENNILSSYSLEENMDFELLVRNLKQQEKVILTLYYCSAYTTKEISQLLKMNENTVRIKIMRAKDKLKKQYYEKGEI